MQFIDLKQQFKRIESQVMSGIQTVLHHGAYIMGPEVTHVEKKLADFVGVNHALAVASGTDALLIALMALDIGPGDEVITTPFSFFATAEVVALLGATLVFVDIDPETYNINADQIEAKITNKTKVIMPVSLYGQCSEMDEINAIAERHGLAVIEDAAQSFGAIYKDRRSCNVSTIGCTSFFPSKPLGCYGDGGACFTQDDELARKMNEIRLHGQEKRYYHTRLGINGRFDTIQAAVLLEKMNLFPEEIELRREVAQRYRSLLPQWLVQQKTPEHHQSVYAQYTLEVSHRELVMKYMQEAGVPTAIHYPLGLHQQPVFKNQYAHFESYPNTERAASRVMSIPMHPYLTLSDQEKVVDVLMRSLERINTMEPVAELI